MKAKTVRNKELYEYLIENYAKSKTPCTLQEVATKFGLSLGHIHEFCNKHGIKKNKEAIDDLIRELKGLGFSVTYIARIIGVTPSAVSIRIKNMKRKGLIKDGE